MANSLTPPDRRTFSDALRADALQFVDPTSREYKYVPPERQPGAAERAEGILFPYITDADVRIWHAELVRFAVTWEALTPAEQCEVLGVDMLLCTVEADIHFRYAKVSGAGMPTIEVTSADERSGACVYSPGLTTLHFPDYQQAATHTAAGNPGQVTEFDVDDVDGERLLLRWRLPNGAYLPTLEDVLDYSRTFLDRAKASATTG